MSPHSKHRPHDFMGGLSRREAGDFTTDKRVIALIGMAVIVGTGGAFAAWVLVSLISLVTNLVWFGRVSIHAVSLAEAPRSLWMVAIPVLGGLVIGLMARFGSEKIRGHGIPEAIEAILIGGSRMSPKVAILKPVSSAISIGTGGPFGAEGPIIMTGGAIGSLFAQCFHLSSAERKTLLVAGAAAGMTAIFGSPIAAIMLAVELLLFEWKPRSFIPVAVAACVSICWRPFLFEAGALFPKQFHMDLPWWGILLCAGMGIVSGLQSGILTTLLYKIEDLFEALPIHWMWCPALGGLIIGLGGLIEPRVLGVGYDIIDGLLNSRMLPQAVLTILLVKAAIWLVALSSGTSGGVLAPLLIFGWLGLPRLGVEGAGLATFLGVVAATLGLWLYFLRPQTFLRMRPRDWLSGPRDWWKLVRIGLPSAVEIGLMFLYLVFILWVLRPFGAAEQAAFGVGQRLLQAGMMPIMAISFAASAVAGQNYGARLGQRVRETFGACLKIGLYCTVVLFAVGELLRWSALSAATRR